MGYIAEPLQRRQLRNLALYINSLLGLQNELYFPVLPFFERVMPCLFEGFTYEIVPKDTFPKGKHADTDVVNHCIRIREDVYYGAANGNGRDRMTIVHEAAHYILLVICGVKFDGSFATSLSRLIRTQSGMLKRLQEKSCVRRI